MHDYPDDLYWEVIEVPTEDLKSKDSYYSFHLPDEVNRVKGVTAIILKETPMKKSFLRLRNVKVKTGLVYASAIRVRLQIFILIS